MKKYFTIAAHTFLFGLMSFLLYLNRLPLHLILQAHRQYVKAIHFRE